MRFPLAALFFLISSFIFFIFFVVASVIVNETHDALMPLATDLPTSDAANLIGLMPLALGVICAIFFLTGILLIFVMDALGDDYEYYYK